MDRTIMDCPTEQDLWASIVGEPATRRVRRHLQQCRACRETVSRRGADIAALRSWATCYTRRTAPSPPEASAAPGGARPSGTVPIGRRPRPPVHLPPGAPRAIGKYEILSVLGAGGQSIVYRALHPVLECEVAIKQSRRVSDSEDARAVLQAEGRWLAQLEHPALPGVYDADVHDGRAYLVMELVRGPMLTQAFTAGLLTPLEAARIVGQLADAVALIHSRGVLHLDLKPENVLLTETGAPRLIDFGLARGPHCAEGRPAFNGGTPEYMAPERWLAGVAPDERSDVFGLGAILYFLLVKHPPMTAAPDLAAAVGVEKFSAADADHPEAGVVNGVGGPRSSRFIDAASRRGRDSSGPPARPAELAPPDGAGKDVQGLATVVDGGAAPRVSGPSGVRGSNAAAHWPGAWAVDLEALDHVAAPRWLLDACRRALAPLPQRISSAGELAAILGRGPRMRTRRNMIGAALLAAGGLLSVAAPLLSSPPALNGRIRRLKLDLERNGDVLPLESVDAIRTGDAWSISAVSDPGSIVELFLLAPSGRVTPLLPLVRQRWGPLDFWRYPGRKRSARLSLPPGPWALCAAALRRPREECGFLHESPGLPSRAMETPASGWCELAELESRPPIATTSGAPRDARHGPEHDRSFNEGVPEGRKDAIARNSRAEMQAWFQALRDDLRSEAADLRVILLRLEAG